MGLLVEGIGDGWIVLRRSGGKAEIVTFKSMDEMRRLVMRELSKTQNTPERSPVLLPRVTIPPFHGETRLRVNGKTAGPALTSTLVDVDCRTCGACCAPADQKKNTHAILEPEDIGKIPGVMRSALVTEKDGHAYMRTKTSKSGVTVCSAFTGAVGKAGKCGIYSKRPMSCYMFEKGGKECLEARSARGV